MILYRKIRGLRNPPNYRGLLIVEFWIVEVILYMRVEHSRCCFRDPQKPVDWECHKFTQLKKRNSSQYNSIIIMTLKQQQKKNFSRREFTTCDISMNWIEESWGTLTETNIVWTPDIQRQLCADELLKNFTASLDQAMIWCYRPIWVNDPKIRMNVLAVRVMFWLIYLQPNNASPIIFWYILR